MVSCEKRTDNFGRWTPTVDQVVDAVKHSGGLCSCADGVPAGVVACAQRAGSSTVTFQLGKDDEPLECTVTTSTVAWGQRRWIVLFAGNRDVSTFFSVSSIQESTAKGFVTYYEGGGSILEDDVKSGARGVSPAMQRDWPKLPADVKKALGAD
jgi:hypothetical protein